MTVVLFPTRVNRRIQCDDLLEPLFDLVELVHRNGIDHGCLLMVIFEDKDHVEILQLELNSFEMNQLYFVERDNEWRLCNTWRKKARYKVSKYHQHFEYLYTETKLVQITAELK